MNALMACSCAFLFLLSACIGAQSHIAYECSFGDTPMMREAGCKMQIPEFLIASTVTAGIITGVVSYVEGRRV